jgi:hypothetical protein
MHCGNRCEYFKGVSFFLDTEKRWRLRERERTKKGLNAGGILKTAADRPIKRHHRPQHRSSFTCHDRILGTDALLS